MVSSEMSRELTPPVFPQPQDKTSYFRASLRPRRVSQVPVFLGARYGVSSFGLLDWTQNVEGLGWHLGGRRPGCGRGVRHRGTWAPVPGGDSDRRPVRWTRRRTVKAIGVELEGAPVPRCLSVGRPWCCHRQ